MPTKPRTLRPPGRAVLCVAPEYPKVGTLVFFALCLNSYDDMNKVEYEMQLVKVGDVWRVNKYHSPELG